MYINSTNQAYPVSERDIRELNPNTSFPAVFVPPEEYSYVFPAPKPEYNLLTESVQESTPLLTQLGTYQQTWQVVPLEQPAIDANLLQVRTARVQAIKDERDRRKFNGVFVMDKWIHTDTYSRTQWMAMVMMGVSLPVIPWTTMDTTTINTTPALANAVFQGTAALDTQLFGYAAGLIQAVINSNDPNSVDITTGWPLTFGENV